MDGPIRKLRRVALRELWKREATNFTVWLRDNLDALSETLGMTLANPRCEHAAGDFSVDLVAEDEDGKPIVIENQLEKSNHDHLGKLLTYLASLGAKAAIWVVSDPRAEHVNAINWLNESSPAAFYLVKVEAFSTGDSEPAALFTLMAGPSEEGRKLGETKRDLAARQVLQKRFWTELLAQVTDKTARHANISAIGHFWLGASAGRKGMYFAYVVGEHDARVELSMDVGDEDNTKRLFNALLSSHDAIERAFGAPLEWDQQPGRRACRIRKRMNLGGLRDQDQWSAIQVAMVEAMARLEKALVTHIRSLPD